MAFSHSDKVPGDPIRSADWNDMGREVARLEGAKVDLAPAQTQTLNGALVIKAGLEVGTPNTGAQLRIYRRQENGAEIDKQGALVVGNDNATSATLRLGYDQNYSWLQGQGRQNLALNPRGGDVGVGTDAPRSRLSVAGGMAVGAAYAGASAAPASSLIVEGSLGVGTPAPAARLHVEGNGRVNGALEVTGALNFGSTGRQMLNLWGTAHGIGVQSNTTYFRSDSHFAFFRGGAHDNAQFAPGTGGAGLMSILNNGNVGVGTMAPAARLQVTGGAIMPAAGNGDAAGILFPRDAFGGAGDAAWMRYYARAGEACTLELGIGNDADDHIALMPVGNVGIGTITPAAKLHVEGGARVNGALEVTGALTAASGKVNGALEVTGALTAASGKVNGALDVTGALSFGSAVRQMVNLWSTGYGIGVQNSTAYFRSDAHFAFFRGGTHSDAQLTPGAGGVGLMSILNTGSVGIGTMSPGARLQVVDGAIMPAAGDSDAAGIMFPRDAFGGGGDAAWIRWVSRGGEATTLEIGVANDGDDHIALNPAGNVGIGTRNPESKLHVVGGDIRWGNGSVLSTDQGGSIELGGNNGKAGTGVPFIDFHHGNGRIEDYNARIINDGDGILTVNVRMFRYNGNLVMASSRELKDGIEELGVDEAERIVAGLSPVRYHMKSDELKEPHLGFIAEDVPEQVAALDRKAISPNHIVAALTRVVKEQQRRIDELARRINGEGVHA